MSRSWIPGQGADGARAEAYSSSAFRSAQAAERAQNILSRYKKAGSPVKSSTSIPPSEADVAPSRHPLAGSPNRPQPYDHHRTPQERPQTKRGRNLEEVRRAFDPSSSPRLGNVSSWKNEGSKSSAFEKGWRGSPSSTLSGVSNSLVSTPQEGVNQVRKGSKAHKPRVKNNSEGGRIPGRLFGQNDPLAEFAERAATREASKAGEGGLRDSIQAAGSRLGLKIMMADELDDVSGFGDVTGFDDVRKEGDVSKEDDVSKDGDVSKNRVPSGEPAVRFARERVVLADSLDLEAADVSASDADVSTKVADVSRQLPGLSRETRDVSKEPSRSGTPIDLRTTPLKVRRFETKCLPVEELALEKEPTGLRHVSHLKVAVHETDDGSERAISPREQYVALTDSSRGSRSGDDLKSDGEDQFGDLQSDGEDLLGDTEYWKTAAAKQKVTRRRSQGHRRRDTGSGTESGEQRDGKTGRKGPGETTGGKERPLSGKSSGSNSQGYGSGVSKSSFEEMAEETGERRGWQNSSGSTVSESRDVNRWRGLLSSSSLSRTGRERNSERSQPLDVDEPTGGKESSVSVTASREAASESTRRETNSIAAVAPFNVSRPILSFSAGGQKIMLASDLFDQLEDDPVSASGPPKDSQGRSYAVETPREALDFPRPETSAASDGAPSRKLRLCGRWDGEEYRAEEHRGEEYPAEEYRAEEVPAEEYLAEEHRAEEYRTEDYPAQCEYDEKCASVADNAAAEARSDTHWALKDPSPEELGGVNRDGALLNERTGSDGFGINGTEMEWAEPDRETGSPFSYRGDSVERESALNGTWRREGKDRNSGEDCAVDEPFPTEPTRFTARATDRTAVNSPCRHCGRCSPTDDSSHPKDPAETVGETFPGKAIERKALSSVGVQVGTLNNKGTQVEFDETRGLLWEGSAAMVAPAAAPAGLLELACARTEARALPSAAGNAAAFVEPERPPPPKWLSIRGSAADDLAALAMADLFRRHLETISARCKRIGYPTVQLGAQLSRPFASAQAGRITAI